VSQVAVVNYCTLIWKRINDIRYYQSQTKLGFLDAVELQLRGTACQSSGSGEMVVGAATFYVFLHRVWYLKSEGGNDLFRTPLIF